jgi:hypothetical protein
MRYKAKNKSSDRILNKSFQFDYYNNLPAPNGNAAIKRIKSGLGRRYR